MIALDSIEQHAPSYTDGSVQKLLSENRDRYIAQSAATVDGKVAELPPVRDWKKSLAAALHDLDTCATELTEDGRVLMHLATGPQVVDMRAFESIRFKGPRI